MPKPGFAATFATLRALLKPYEASYDVIVDTPGSYYLSTRISKTGSGHPIWFGASRSRRTT